jgi:hypothetical protein
MPGFRQDSDAYDDQDNAEVLDETNFEESGRELRTFEDLVDVFDETQRTGDASDEDAAEYDADDFNPDEDFDADELERDDDGRELMAADETDLTDENQPFDEDQLDADSIDGLDMVADADLVEGGEDDFTNFQSKGLNDADLKRMGYAGPSGGARKS